MQDKQQILNQNRLKIRQAIFMAHTEQMNAARERLANTHLDTDELLVVGLKRYEQTLQNYAKIYHTVDTLSDDEIKQVMAQGSTPNEIFASCLDLATQKENQKARNKLSLLQKALCPFAILGQLLTSKRKAQPIQKKERER